MNQNAIIKKDDVLSTLAEAGFDLETELIQSSANTNTIDIPVVRIEHNISGKHRMFIEHGESYLGNGEGTVDVPNNTLVGTVIAEQEIRALWSPNEKYPRCSSINGVISSNAPQAESCKQCEHAVIGGSCKPKIRLLILSRQKGEIKPLSFNLSPVSIKRWSQHKRKLKRSGLPVVAANCMFTLEDIQRNGFRYAEVKIEMDGISDVEILKAAKTARGDYQRYISQVSHRDYSDPGDKAG